MDIKGSQPGEIVTLSWTDARRAGTPLYLLDAEGKQLISMSGRDTYRFRMPGCGTRSLVVTTADLSDADLFDPDAFISVDPNPFRGETVFKCRFPVDQLAAGTAWLEVFDQAGQRLSRTAVERITPEETRIGWTTGLKSGIYLVRLSTDLGWSTQARMILVK